MGLLDELERKGRKRSLVQPYRIRPRIHRYYRTPDGRILTPQQLGRQRREQRRERAAVIVGVISWIPALFTLGTYWLILTVPFGAVFTVLALSIAFSKNDSEVSKHSWKAWREYKSYVLALFGSRKR